GTTVAAAGRSPRRRVGPVRQRPGGRSRRAGRTEAVPGPDVGRFLLGAAEVGQPPQLFFAGLVPVLLPAGPPPPAQPATHPGTLGIVLMIVGRHGCSPSPDGADADPRIARRSRGTRSASSRSAPRLAGR